MTSFRDFVENREASLPAVVYHVSPSADQIIQSRHFLVADKLGAGRQVLGGSTTDAVSFTTESNARNYQEGLEIYRHAAQGSYDWRDDEMMYNLANYFGLDWRTYENIRAELQRFDAFGKMTDEEMLSEFLAKISYYSFIHSRKTKGNFLPLVLRQGSSFPAVLRTSAGIGILAIGTGPGNGKTGPQKFRWVESEQEWKVFDPENFDYTTLRLVSSGVD